MYCTLEFQRGIDDRSKGIGSDRNPYSTIFYQKRKDWENGWKLENWRRNKMGRINVEGGYHAREKIHR